MNIAVLMACHNRRETTIGCLARLFDVLDVAAKCSAKVFLVDDGSNDGTADAVHRRFSDVCVIEGSGSLHWAKGMSHVWKRAVEDNDWDAYLWLNDDTLLNDDFFDLLLKKNDGKSIVVGELKNSAGITVYGVRENGLFTGNCVLVPRNVYHRLGVLCGDYSHAWADSDYAMRAKRAGVPVVSAGVVGTVEWHPNRPSLKNRSLGERLSLLRDPKGWNLHDLWLYRRRNWGVLAAVMSCIHLIYRVVRGVR